MAAPPQGFAVRTLKESELPQWLDHLNECFPTTGKYYFEQHYLHDEEKSLERIYVAENIDAKEIASTIYLRTINIQGRQVRCAAIGEVSTKEKYRKQGLAALLLERAVQDGVSNIQGVTMSILRSTKFAPFYAKLGWTSVPQAFATIAPTTEGLQRKVESSASKMRLRIEKLNTEALGEWAERLCIFYTAYAKQFNGSFVRTPQYYQGWISANFRIYPGVLLVALDEANSLVGYMAVQIKEPYILKEFVPATALDRDSGIALLTQLLHAVRAHAPLTEKAKLMVPTPTSYLLAPPFSPDDPLSPISVDSNPASMYRILNKEQMAGITIPELYILCSYSSSTAQESLVSAPPGYASPNSHHCFFPLDSY